MNHPADHLVLQFLEKTGRRVARWRAAHFATRGLALVLAVLLVCGLLDFWLRIDRPGRIAAWSVLVVLGLLALWRVARALLRHYTPDGVAAMLERAFPKLDNHLINYLQFARDPGTDSFKRAYVQRESPAWRDLDVLRLKDRRAHRTGALLLAAAVALLLLPGAFFGKAWSVALWRTVNPFSETPPLTLTRILDVQPGNAAVPMGQPVVFTCTVQGFTGHKVSIDIDPGDSDPATYALGTIANSNPSEFSHRLPKVSSPLRYRFHAGDAQPTDWFVIESVPPPSFTKIRLAIAPPAYTRKEKTTLDPRRDLPVVPAGSTVTVSASTNTPLASAALLPEGAEKPIPMTRSGDSSWTCQATIESGASLALTGTDSKGTPLREDIPMTVQPDLPPAIEIISPGARTILPPGTLPRIEFRAADDYGLSSVRIEQITSGAPDAKPAVQIEWTSKGSPKLEQSWTAKLPPHAGREIAFRIVARDNRPDTPNESLSTTLVFTLPSLAEVAKEHSKLEQAAFAGLEELIDSQKQNIAETQRLSTAISTATADEWNAAAGNQQKIRDLARKLLADAMGPLGALAPKVKNLYVNEMVVAVDALRSVPTAATDKKPRRAREALSTEKTILAELTRARAAFSKSSMDRKIAGISSMIESLIRRQSDTLDQSRLLAKQDGENRNPTKTLVDSQDILAEDLTAFVNQCTTEANSVRGADPAFASTLEQIAARASQLAIRNDMVMAAERLDSNLPDQAVPLEERSLKNLKSLRNMITAVQLDRESANRETTLKALAQAKEKLDKIKEKYQRDLAIMDEIRGATDKSDDEKLDALEEAYEEIKEKTREALLEIPTDLHVFTDLNVANELVDDVFSIFQEVEQAEGTGEGKETREMEERAFAKEDAMLEIMEKAEERIDDMETWLGDEPDSEKVDTEAFDREEMPEDGIATGELGSEVDDMIGDLLDEDEDMEQKANDSATTHAVPDMQMGWEIKEGNIASYAAKGKSGNETPDHHEQDGRSNVGRQGMSTGETAASSGTISEGDKNIEARRTEDPTQSGQIKLDGEADTRATGGGKLGTGKADAKGMSGGVERMDSNERGSWEGMAALMAEQADEVHAKASLKNIRVDELKRAAHHLRQSGDAIAKGDIAQMKEERRMAVSALRRAKSKLDAGPTNSIQPDSGARPLDDAVESAPDHAPPRFRDKVAEYYKALNKSM